MGLCVLGGRQVWIVCIYIKKSLCVHWVGRYKLLRVWRVNDVVLIVFGEFASKLFSCSSVFRSPSYFALGLNFEIPIEFFIWQLNGELSIRMSPDKEKLRVLTFPGKSPIFIFPLNEHEKEAHSVRVNNLCKL